MAASWSAASLHARRLSSARYAAGLSAGGSFATHLLISSATRLRTGFAASAVSASSCQHLGGISVIHAPTKV
jgi:poly(3-hydroxybutyrate) depolymerase